MSEKKKVLMVCLGNICRSPIAEAVFQNEMNKRALRNQWEVDSVAIMGYHTGKRPDNRALITLKENGITHYSHRARQIVQTDFNEYDWILGMDTKNIQDLKYLEPENSRAKVELLGSYNPNGETIIRDPYYDSESVGFQKVYDQCLTSVTGFLNIHTS